MSDDRLGWGALEPTPLADYRIFRVVRKQGTSPRTGKPVQFHCIEAADWVQVVSVTRDGLLIMVEQFRPGAEVRSLEFPAGMVDPQEQPEHSAARELAEETGYRAARMVSLGSLYPNPAINSNRLHLWLALDCEMAVEVAPDEGEDVHVRLVTHEDFARLHAQGEINHALVITAWHLYESWRSQRSASRS